MKLDQAFLVLWAPSLWSAALYPANNALRLLPDGAGEPVRLLQNRLLLRRIEERFNIRTLETHDGLVIVTRKNLYAGLLPKNINHGPLQG